MSSLSTPPPSSPPATAATTIDDGDTTINLKHAEAQQERSSSPSGRKRTAPPTKKAATTRSKRANSSSDRNEEATPKQEVVIEDEREEAQSNDVAEQKANPSNAPARSTRSRGRQSGSSSASPPALSDKHRQRSVSTFKELASLGLSALGDGEEEPLLPRRSRRAALSPARRQGGESVDNGAEESDEEEEEEDDDDDDDDDDANVPQTNNSPIPDGEVDEGGEGETRCVCGSQDENVGLMIQCDSCKCWQHCICMGLHTEAECPDVYFCEQCRPEVHIPLLRSLGVLPAARSHKKGATKLSGKTSSTTRDAKKELKEAKEAVLLLAADNERRRNAGQEPLTGWSVHQNPAVAASLTGHDTTPPSTTHHRRQSSEARLRTARSQSREDDTTTPTAPGTAPRTTTPGAARHQSPKRRSTMNSRDSGWEPIPPGLLAEDWDKKEDEDERAARKRKRGREEHSPARSSSPQDLTTTGAAAVDLKRRRVSAGISHSPAAEERSRSNGRRAASPDVAPLPPPPKKGAWNKKKQPALDENGNPIVHAKHPNQYTYRNKEKPSAAAATAAAPAATASTAQTSGADSPSPSKARPNDHRKGAVGLRADTGASRTGTPAPPNPGSAFGLPDHLAHLAPLLPAQLEPLTLHPPSATKALPRTGVQAARAAAAAAAASTSSHEAAAALVEPLAYTTLSLSEARTKIRFPPKRMTMGEMRKRVRNIGEYISRSQIEAVERSRRMRLLGISINIDEPRVKPRGEETVVPPAPGGDGDTTMTDATTVPSCDKLPPPTPSSAPCTVLMPSSDAVNGNAEPTSATSAPAASASDDTAQIVERNDDMSLTMRLVEELTKELASFTQRFGAAPGLPHGVSSA